MIMGHQQKHNVVFQSGTLAMMPSLKLDINWRSAIQRNLGFGVSEDEINPFYHVELLVKKVSFYELDDRARKKYIEGAMGIGKNWKPWIDPKLMMEAKQVLPHRTRSAHDGPPEENPQTGIGQPPVDPATIQPHLDWPRWPLPPWTKCKHAECKPHARRLKQMVEQTDAVWKPPTNLNEGFYYIQQKDLNNILQSQTYLDGQEAHRQAKIAEAERIRAQHQGSVEDYRTNPSNIPFPVPEEYQEELERRLTEEMTAEGYRPLRVQQDFIDSGGYDDAPSDWSYVQGEYQEFLDEIEAQDWDEAYAEYSDVEGHTAYYLWTNYRIDMPVYTHDHIDKVLFRIRIFEDLFAHYGFDFGPEYLKGGSNYEKVFKVRNALDAAADAQGKPRVTDDDEQLGAVVKRLVAARKDMTRKSSNDNSIDYPDSLDEAFELMKRVAKEEP